MLKIKDFLAKGWTKIPCKISELRLDLTLVCGQSFRWKEISPQVWASVLNEKALLLSQNDNFLFFKVLEKPMSSSPYSSMPRAKKMARVSNSTMKSFLRKYFQLDCVNISELYQQWNKVDPYFAARSPDFPGIRILCQSPTENLFSFICSSNNNIVRISKMVENLCIHFGNDLGIHLEGHDFFTFPSVTRLAQNGVEEKLRKLGFGYRAKFINQSAKYIMKNGGIEWLENLRMKPYSEAHAELLKLPGIGPKVADCICLMSLEKHGVVPVDVHVWKIAKKYAMQLSHQQSKSIDSKHQISNIDSQNELLKQLSSTKSLTKRVYNYIGNYFQNIWGSEFAGWAQAVVFAADLTKFKKTNNESQKKNKKKRKEKIEISEGNTKNHNNNNIKKKKVKKKIKK